VTRIGISREVSLVRLVTSQSSDGRLYCFLCRTLCQLGIDGSGKTLWRSSDGTDQSGTGFASARLLRFKRRLHTMDLHATLLARMGLDPESLTYR
jgi:hypothetical protein